MDKKYESTTIKGIRWMVLGALAMVCAYTALGYLLYLAFT